MKKFKFKKFMQANEVTVGSDIAEPDVKIGDETDICPITGKPKKKKKKKKNKQLRKMMKNVQ